MTKQIPAQLMQPLDGKWNYTDTNYYCDDPSRVNDGYNKTVTVCFHPK